MKIWVDDIRPAPDGWHWCKTSHEAIRSLAIWQGIEEFRGTTGNVEVMSLDHDLGGDDTTRPIVLWCCENDFWPVEVVVHSANPPGVYWLESMIERYHPSNAHKYTR